jgi:hypothetical protein
MNLKDDPRNGDLSAARDLRARWFSTVVGLDCVHKLGRYGADFAEPDRLVPPIHEC